MPQTLYALFCQVAGDGDRVTYIGRITPQEYHSHFGDSMWVSNILFVLGEAEDEFEADSRELSWFIKEFGTKGEYAIPSSKYNWPYMRLSDISQTR